MINCTKIAKNLLKIDTNNEADFRYAQRLLYKMSSYDSDAISNILPFTFTIDDVEKKIIVESMFLSADDKTGSGKSIVSVLQSNNIIVNDQGTVAKSRCTC